MACNTTIAKAAQGKTLVNAKLCVLPDGSQAAGCNHLRYASDAVVADSEILWFRSDDGGTTWTRWTSRPEGVPPVENNALSVPLRFADGMYLAVGSLGWTDFEDTPAKRKELLDKGYYFFSPEEGNAPGIISVIDSMWMMRSTDEGRNWHKSDIRLPLFVPHLACYGDPVLSQNGKTFIQPMWGRLNMKTEPKYVSALVLLSPDRGETWDLRVVAEAQQGEGGFDLAETAMTRAANGDIIALIRTTAQRELWTCVSSDDGYTWSEPRDSGLRGSTPAMCTTTDGLVVGFYIRRGTEPGGGEFKRTGVYACVSDDNGRTWDAGRQVCLRDTRTDTVDGYPCVASLPDGSVYGVYGFREDGPALGGTRFHPRDEAFRTPTGADRENGSTTPGNADRDAREWQVERGRQVGAKDAGQAG